jgi:hypothetical protein
MEDENFSTLVETLQAAGLVDTLEKGDGPFMSFRSCSTDVPWPPGEYPVAWLPARRLRGSRSKSLLH